MATMHPEVRNAFSIDLGLAQEAVRTNVVAKRANSATGHWRLWVEFCTEHNVDPWFKQGEDPIPYLQVFALRYRDGRIAPRGKPVRSGTVSDALRSIGQAFQRMGAPDPRFNEFGATDYRLKAQLRKYNKEDPPAQRVKPIPMSVVKHLIWIASLTNGAVMACTCDMIAIAFFFLMRPGEYTWQPTNTPFKLQDVKLFEGQTVIDPMTATEAQLNRADAVSLTFTTQKNGVKGEVISHGLSGHPTCCPVKTIVRRIKYLRSENFPADTPLCTCKDNGGSRTYIQAKSISVALKMAIQHLDPDGSRLGIKPEEVDSRSLRAGGATALLVAGVGFDTIQLLGRWKSDAMIRYLHISANPQVRRYASAMYQAGLYTLQPGWYVPALPLDAPAPAA